MLEHYRQPLLPPSGFAKRMARCIFLALLLLVLTLLAGTAGFHQLEKFLWIDAFLNAVLIMTGLGLVNPAATPAGKLFTSFYALLSTVMFFVILGILITPLLHRLLHRFHLDLEEKK